VVNADGRGCGHSDGTGKLLSRQEAEDTYDLVQWIADWPWCDGNVVMLGVSYLAISQYAVAALQPPALRAICPWEGFTDAYRDLTLPGGIREFGFTRLWSKNIDRDTRQTYTLGPMQDAHPLRDEFWCSLAPDLAAIKVPMLVCGSFSDNNLHTRGSVRAFTRGGSTHARLYTHRGGKWTTFYFPTGHGREAHRCRLAQHAVLHRERPLPAPPLRQIVFAVRMDAQDHRPSDMVAFSEDVDPQHCSVASWHIDVTLDEDVARWSGDGYRGFGDTANAFQCVPQSAGPSPGPVQGRCRVSGHANTLRRLDVALPPMRHSAALSNAGPAAEKPWLLCRSVPHRWPAATATARR
jgi:hypothetical protein